MEPASPAPAVAPDETLDRLSGAWWIFQLRDGQRYGTDDLLTAWIASEARPAARRLLDLGSGVGSVGLMTLLRLPADARLTTVEVQDRSVALAHKTVRLNGLGGRVDVRHGDLRAPGLLAADERFDLVTANPPYLPPSHGSPPRHPQRAAARVELHGDVFDYCRTAARHLADGGRFCFCHVARDPRPEQAIAGAGLHLRARRDVVFRHGRAPRLALFVCARAGERRDPPPLHVRDERGGWTDGYRAICRAMGVGGDARAMATG